MRDPNDRRRHLILEGVTEARRFVSPSQMVTPSPIPNRDRVSHSGELMQDINRLREHAATIRQQQVLADIEDGNGIQVEFESYPDIELAFESLARDRLGIELLNVRRDEHRTLATVYIPDGRLNHFERMIGAYAEERRDQSGRRRDHSALFNTIQTIRSASLRALWTDDDQLFPANDDDVIWWEVWLPVRRDRSQVLDGFLSVIEAQNMQVADGQVTFPERTVLQVKGSAGQMKRSMMLLNSIAELRRVKETADFFDALNPDEQPEWTDELLGRTEFVAPDASTPYICILDTGINRGHPLLEHALTSSDLHAVDPAWGVDDAEGHGTGMAGLALFGDITEALGGAQNFQIHHRLESVKLLPSDGANAGDPQHHAYLTMQAVYRPEVGAPDRARIFSMAVTARDHRDRGRPSAWSASIDRLAADVDNQGQNPRLILLSGGNVRDPDAWMAYPTSNSSDGIHDPGQAWNAITVGAFTNLTDITEHDASHYQPIARPGGLSPFSTTSSTWQRPWPLKPDLVFEGGNAGNDGIGAACMPSLSLLTTNFEPQNRHYTTTNATSAATAQAARMAAQLMAAYPQLWPETIRALLVHSADWTSEMRTMYLPAFGQPSKADIEQLIRHCGFGVPSLDRSLWSASDSLTLVVQEALHPFRRAASGGGMRDMHLHRLPWPLGELQALGDQQVRMKVSLSYFIEPNPSARGVRSRYRYESHGLRFDVKRSLESEPEFLARINAAARDEEHGIPTGGNDPSWLLGKQKRHYGSIHSDVWTGSAADLASRGVIAVYPAMGWWRTRTQLERVDSTARYSLLISIEAPETEVDLYNVVANQIGIPIAIRV